jgi:hypothetical protein
MVKWIAQLETIRTTADGAGSSCDVITGMGTTAELALAELRRAGEELARRLVQEGAEEAEADEADEATKREAKKRADYEAQGERLLREKNRVQIPYPAHVKAEIRAAPWRYQPRDGGQRLFRFEVVDVRLTPAPEKGGRGDWLAYGTLARLGEPQN